MTQRQVLIHFQRQTKKLEHLLPSNLQLVAQIFQLRHPAKPPVVALGMFARHLVMNLLVTLVDVVGVEAAQEQTTVLGLTLDLKIGLYQRRIHSRGK